MSWRLRESTNLEQRHILRRRKRKVLNFTVAATSPKTGETGNAMGVALFLAVASCIVSFAAGSRKRM